LAKLSKEYANLLLYMKQNRINMYLSPESLGNKDFQRLSLLNWLDLEIFQPEVSKNTPLLYKRIDNVGQKELISTASTNTQHQETILEDAVSTIEGLNDLYFESVSDLLNEIVTQAGEFLDDVKACYREWFDEEPINETNLVEWLLTQDFITVLLSEDTLDFFEDQLELLHEKYGLEAGQGEMISVSLKIEDLIEYYRFESRKNMFDSTEEKLYFANQLISFYPIKNSNVVLDKPEQSLTDSLAITTAVAEVEQVLTWENSIIPSKSIPILIQHTKLPAWCAYNYGDRVQVGDSIYVVVGAELVNSRPYINLQDFDGRQYEPFLYQNVKLYKPSISEQNN
jgi:hypothetical protein